MAGALLLGLAVRFGPAATLAVTLGWPRSERWLGPLLAEPERGELDVAVGDRTLRGDLYRPPSPRGALLLVHGLSPAGRRHPDLQRLARLLARQRWLVLVPHFESLAAFRLTGREVEEISAALGALGRRSDAVGVIGFSFGAGPALLAAAEVPALRLVGSFGGYADLRPVIAFITTGVHTWSGRRYVQRQEEYNRWKLLMVLAGFAETAADRSRLGAIAARKLANPFDDTEAFERELGPEGRAVLALVLNRREDAVAGLLARLPEGARAAMDRLSPLPAVPRLRGRLLIAHGSGDESIPFTESLRLAAAAGGRARLVILRTFHHTGPRPFWRSLGDRGRDAWNLLGLADDLLSHQEGTGVL